MPRIHESSLFAALSTSVAIALLAGCGGSQAPVAAPGAMPQTSAIVQHAAHGKSWMLPEASSEDLLYVSSPAHNEVNVFTYPQTKLVGRLKDLSVASGLCSDKTGNVWVITQNQSGIGTLVEFAHGAKNATKTLNIPGVRPAGCAVDPLTNDLAVGHSNDEVSIYPSSQGTPNTYTDSHFTHLDSSTYDDAGNLFAYGAGSHGSAAYDLAELPYGATSFVDLSLGEEITVPTFVEWGGKHVSVAGLRSGGRTDPERVYRISISGSGVTVLGTTTVQPDHRFGAYAWIGDRELIQPDWSGSTVNFYNYPKGGAVLRTLPKPHSTGLVGVTVSRAPHR